MNDNNLFDDNQNTNPFETQEPVEAPTVEENVAEESAPAEVPVQETPAIDLGINVLNNVGANAPDVKQQVKKSVSKTPFIIIAAILLLSLFLGGGGYAVKTLVFDKAPNKVEMPEDDETHMIKDEEKEEEEEESDEDIEEDDSGSYIEDDDNETTKPETDDETSSGGQQNASSSTLEGTVKKEEKGQTKISIENFEAVENEIIGFYLNNDKILYEVTKISNDIVLYKKEAIEGDVEKGQREEVFRKSFEPKTLIAEDGSTYLSSFTIHGTTSGSYVIFKIDVEGEGTYMIFDENMSLVQEGYYDYSITPYVTDGAIYYPTIECGNEKHKYTINKLDIESGNVSNLKTNDYTNDTLYCE